MFAIRMKMITVITISITFPSRGQLTHYKLINYHQNNYITTRSNAAGRFQNMVKSYLAYREYNDERENRRKLKEISATKIQNRWYEY